MEVSATPAGQIIIRIEASEVKELCHALGGAAYALELLVQTKGPWLDDSITAEQSADWCESLGDAIEREHAEPRRAAERLDVDPL